MLLGAFRSDDLTDSGPEGKGRNMAFNCCGRITVALALLLAINLVLAGVFITSFSFDFKGAAGLALGDSAVC